MTSTQEWVWCRTKAIAHSMQGAFRVVGVSLLLLSASIHAPVRADDAWHVVAKKRDYLGEVLLPNLPLEGTWEIRDVFLADDTSGGEIHFDIERDGKVELWASRDGVFVAYAAEDSVGVLGAGRMEGESDHVFRSIYPGVAKVDMSRDGYTVFAGRAGPPAPNSLNFATYGVWRSSPDGNVEIARARNWQAGQAPSPLDPGLGDFRFHNASDFVRQVWALPGGEAIFVARVLEGDDDIYSWRSAIIRHTPGVGNEICAMHGSFLGQTITLDAVFVDVHQNVYVESGNYGQGFWKVCAGEPQPLAVESQTGVLGPALPSPTAYFPFVGGGLGSFATSSTGSVYFPARVFDSAPDAWEGQGMFEHRDGANHPIALTGMQGEFGSGLDGMPFAYIDQSFSPKVAGEELLFAGEVTTDAQNVRGLWRVGADRIPVPIALEGTTDPRYAPSPGRVWKQLSLNALHAAIFSNGDVVLKAAAIPDASGSESIWLLRRGSPPEEILRSGDLIPVPTPSGIVMAPVSGSPLFSGFNWPGSGARDTWADASGSIIVQASVEGFGTLLLKRQVFDPDFIFSGDFEQ